MKINRDYFRAITATVALAALSTLFLTGMDGMFGYRVVPPSPVPKLDGRWQGKIISHGAGSWGDSVRVDVIQLYSQLPYTPNNKNTVSPGPLFGVVSVFHENENGKISSPSHIYKWNVTKATSSNTTQLNLEDWTGTHRYQLQMKLTNPRSMQIKIKDEHGHASAEGTLKSIPVPAFAAPENKLCYKTRNEGLGWLPQVCDGMAAGTALQKKGIRAIKIWSPDPSISVCYKVSGSTIINPMQMQNQNESYNVYNQPNPSTYPKKSSKEVCDGQEASLRDAYQIEGIQIRHTGPSVYKLRGWAHVRETPAVQLNEGINGRWKEASSGGNTIFIGTTNQHAWLDGVSLRLDGATPRPKPTDTVPTSEVIKSKQDLKRIQDRFRSIQK